MNAHEKSGNGLITPSLTDDDALRMREQSYKRLIDNSLQGLAVLIPAQGFVFVNDDFCDLFGFDRDELDYAVPKIGLSRNILRVETAAIVAAAMLVDHHHH